MTCSRQMAQSTCLEERRMAAAPAVPDTAHKIRRAPARTRDRRRRRLTVAGTAGRIRWRSVLQARGLERGTRTAGTPENNGSTRRRRRSAVACATWRDGFETRPANSQTGGGMNRRFSNLSNVAAVAVECLRINCRTFSKDNRGEVSSGLCWLLSLRISPASAEPTSLSSTVYDKVYSPNRQLYRTV